MTERAAPANLEQEIERYVADDNPRRKAEFTNAVRENVRRWERRLLSGEEAPAARWLLLDAYVARIDATEHPGEVFFAERIGFAREVCERLLRRDGDAFVASCPNRRRILLRLLGPARLDRCLDALAATTAGQQTATPGSLAL